MSSAQKDNFTFPDLFPFSLFLSCLLTLASTFSTMLNRNDKSRQFDLFPNWGEVCSGCRFLINALYQNENNLFDSLFWVDSFLTLWRNIEFLQILFLQLLLDITFFLFYSVYMALSVYIGVFPNCKPTLHSWDKHY